MMYQAVKGLSCEYDVDYSKKGSGRFMPRCSPGIWTGSPAEYWPRHVCERCNMPILWENWYTKRSTTRNSGAVKP